jgi:hypothetical protein
MGELSSLGVRGVLAVRDPRSGGDIQGAGTGAEHLAQVVVAGGAQLEVVRDRRDHETAVHPAAADAFHRPEPRRECRLKEWTAGVFQTVLVWDRGAMFVHDRTLRTEIGHTAFRRNLAS